MRSSSSCRLADIPSSSSERFPFTIAADWKPCPRPDRRRQGDRRSEGGDQLQRKPHGSDAWLFEHHWIGSGNSSELQGIQAALEACGEIKSLDHGFHGCTRIRKDSAFFSVIRAHPCHPWLVSIFFSHSDAPFDLIPWQRELQCD
jgi:hypothetical protein